VLDENCEDDGVAVGAEKVVLLARKLDSAPTCRRSNRTPKLATAIVSSVRCMVRALNVENVSFYDVCLCSCFKSILVAVLFFKI
jgi:hypothetical protein